MAKKEKGSDGMFRSLFHVQVQRNENESRECLSAGRGWALALRNRIELRLMEFTVGCAVMEQRETCS